MTKPRLKIIHLIATSYAGSTWLNLMLGTHRDAFTVGELKSVKKLGRPICQMHGDDCPVWSQFNDDDPANAYEQIAQITGKQILIVTNSVKYYPNPPTEHADSYYIHLLRDGRAITASYMRKNKGRSAAWASRVWVRNHRRNIKFLKHQPQDRQRTVYYEQLKQNPIEGLQALGQWLGMDYDTAALEYWRNDLCYLGGNRGTFFAIKEKRGEEMPEDPRVALGKRAFGDFDPSHYQKADIAKFVDERWKKELTPWQLRVFAVCAGLHNRRLGYGKNDLPTPPEKTQAQSS